MPGSACPPTWSAARSGAPRPGPTRAPSRRGPWSGGRATGVAGSRQPLPGDPGGGPGGRRRGGGGLRPGPGHGHGDDPLRQPRPGPPGVHRLPGRHGPGDGPSRHLGSRPATGLRAGTLERGGGLPEGDGDCGQLRLGQPPPPRPHRPRGIRHRSGDRRGAGRHGSGLRRGPQSGQGGGASGGSALPTPVRAPQGGHPGLRAGASGAARRTAGLGPAGADTRVDGHRFLGAAGSGGQPGLRHRGPRRRAG